MCVRYRYDSKRGKRYKTAEIIIEEIDWAPQPATSGARAKRNPNDMVGVRTAYHESQLRAKVKKAGAIWRPPQQIGELPYGVARILGLADRLLPECPYTAIYMRVDTWLLDGSIQMLMVPYIGI